MSDVKAPAPPVKKSKKPQWLLNQEARQKSVKKEGEAEAQEEKEKDATNMFSRSKDFSKRVILKKPKEEQPEVKTLNPAKEEGIKSKRRHESTEAEDEDAGAPARKTYVWKHCSRDLLLIDL
jgi:hypothetical protein